MRNRHHAALPTHIEMDCILAWIVNVIVVLMLPIKIGLSGASAGLFFGYCVLCVLALTLAEDWRFLRDMVSRPDVLGYLAAKLAIVVAFGICPYLIAHRFA